MKLEDVIEKLSWIADHRNHPNLSGEQPKCKMLYADRHQGNYTNVKLDVKFEQWFLFAN